MLLNCFPLHCVENENQHSENKIDQSLGKKKSKRKIQGVPQSQTAVLPRHQEEEETDKTKQVQSK